MLRNLELKMRARPGATIRQQDSFGHGVPSNIEIVSMD